MKSAAETRPIFCFSGHLLANAIHPENKKPGTKPGF
jgi:hypothetical protein